MNEKKFVLPFVNKGKPFTFPIWTVEKHEEALKHIADYTNGKKLETFQAERFFKQIVLYSSLHEVDDTVTMDDVKSLHIENLATLADAAYTAGKMDVNFRQPKKKGKKKE